MKHSISRSLADFNREGYDNPRLMPIDERLKVYNTRCFDTKEAMKKLRVSNRSMQLINAHLILDHILSKFLKDQLINKPSFKSERLNFSNRVDLIYSMGCIPHDLMIWIKKINGVRNKIAHEMGYKISRDFSDEVIKNFPVQIPSDPTKKYKFALSLMLIIIRLENYRIKKIHEDVETYIALKDLEEVVVDLGLIK